MKCCFCFVGGYVLCIKYQVSRHQHISTLLHQHISKSAHQNFCFAIRFPLIDFCRLHLKRLPTMGWRLACFVIRPCTRARHLRQFRGCISRFIRAFTSSSERPNCILMASKGVRSSQAISMMRSISVSLNSFIFCKTGNQTAKTPLCCVKWPIYEGGRQFMAGCHIFLRFSK